jgi:hypothetical protein
VRFAGPAGARLTVTDVGGRIVARLSIGSGSGVAMWDGRGPQGQLLAPGIYLARCDVAGHAQRLKLVKLDGRR